MRTPQVSFFTFYAQSCKIFMSQQWGPGRCPLKCSVDIFSSGVIAPEFHVNAALSAPPPQKKTSPSLFWREMVITTTGRWGTCFHRGSGRVTFKKKKEGALFAVSIFTVTHGGWALTDWGGWCVCGSVFELETERRYSQNYQYEWTSDVTLWWTDLGALKKKKT